MSGRSFWSTAVKEDKWTLQFVQALFLEWCLSLLFVHKIWRTGGSGHTGGQHAHVTGARQSRRPGLAGRTGAQREQKHGNHRGPVRMGSTAYKRKGTTEGQRAQRDRAHRIEDRTGAQDAQRHRTHKQPVCTCRPGAQAGQAQGQAKLDPSWGPSWG